MSDQASKRTSISISKTHSKLSSNSNTRINSKSQPKSDEKSKLRTKTSTKLPSLVVKKYEHRGEPSLRQCLLNLAYEINPEVADKLAACAAKLK